MTLQVTSYPQATVRVDAQDEVTLPCGRWAKRRDGFVYRDADGSVGGVRKVVYSRTRFLARLQDIRTRIPRTTRRSSAPGRRPAPSVTTDS
jgi:hypothetical protein